MRWLQEQGVTIWDEWADEDGELGPVYGKQWRSWESKDGRVIDQIANVVHSIKTNPNSRRHIVSAWNPAEVDQMALPPCHCLFQFFVAEAENSAANSISAAPMSFSACRSTSPRYALLTQMMAQVTDLAPGEFVHTFGDAHLYTNHFDQAKLQLARTPYPAPTLKLNPARKDIFGFEYGDFTLEDYLAHPPIKAPIAV